MNYSQRLLTSYRTLGKRDRKILIALSIVGLPLLVYLFWLRPVYDFYAGSKQTFLSNRELLQWMHQNKSALLSQSRSPSKSSAEIDFIQVVSAEAKKRGVSIDRLQPQGKNKIRLWCQEVTFDSLVSLLATLQYQGLMIETAIIDKTSTPGKVSFQGTLTK